MPDKQDALLEILAIAKNHGLSADDIAQAMKDTPAQTAGASSGTLSRIFNYLGGILVFAGICIFINMNWDAFNSATRVLLTLGTGFALFIAALAALKDTRYANSATPLFLMSSALQPTGILVMLREYAAGGNPRHGIIFMASLMLIQHGATFVATRRTTLAFTTIVFGCILFATLCDLWGTSHNLTGIILGTSLICIAYALDNSRHSALAGFWYFIGASALLVSLFDATHATSFEVIFPGIATLLIFLSTHVRSRALLAAATLGMLFYIGWFTHQHFAHVVGWPLALIIGGLTLICFGVLAVKINNKYIKQ